MDFREDLVYGRERRRRTNGNVPKSGQDTSMCVTAKRWEASLPSRQYVSSPPAEQSAAHFKLLGRHDRALLRLHQAGKQLAHSHVQYIFLSTFLPIRLFFQKKSAHSKQNPSIHPPKQKKLLKQTMKMYGFCQSEANKPNVYLSLTSNTVVWMKYVVDQNIK